MTDFDVKVKFLRNIGIEKEHYHEGFFDTIQNLNQLLTNTEIGYCSVSDRCDGNLDCFVLKMLLGQIMRGMQDIHG